MATNILAKISIPKIPIYNKIAIIDAAARNDGKQSQLVPMKLERKINLRFFGTVLMVDIHSAADEC